MGSDPALFIKLSSRLITMVVSLLSFVSRLRAGLCACRARPPCGRCRRGPGAPRLLCLCHGSVGMCHPAGERGPALLLANAGVPSLSLGDILTTREGWRCTVLCPWFGPFPFPPPASRPGTPAICPSLCMTAPLGLFVSRWSG